MRFISYFVVFLVACGGGGPSPDQCISRAVWTQGNEESPRMHPGGACIQCHSSGEGPRYTIAGTVFHGAREQTDCNGANGATESLSVVVTDANGKKLTLPVNDVGNFFTKDPVAFPFQAKVVSSSGKENVMTAAQSVGDCNTCHTQMGANAAPGRILAP